MLSLPAIVNDFQITRQQSSEKWAGFYFLQKLYVVNIFAKNLLVGGNILSEPQCSLHLKYSITESLLISL